MAPARNKAKCLASVNHIRKKKKIPYPFYCTAYDYSHADLDSLCNHLRDAPWKDIFKLSASAIEFCKWVPVGILVVAKFEIQLDLASELESGLRDTVDWGRNWLVNFNVGKTQFVLFDRSNNSGAINVKMDGSVLEEK